jgi:hypothetical protein
LQYAKAIAAAVAAVLAAVVPALYVPGPLGFAEWVNIVLLACGAIQIYNSANLPGHWEYAKMIAAVVTAAGVAVSSALSDGDVTRGEWVQIAIAMFGAFAVYRTPNAPVAAGPAGRHEAPDGAAPSGLFDTPEDDDPDAWPR